MDAVVIGSGPNGLVAAAAPGPARLAGAGAGGPRRPGGAVWSERLTLPGYLHDVGAAFFPFADHSPAFRYLDLAGAGLRWANAPRESCHPAPDGTCATISRDSKQTAPSFGRGRAGLAQAGPVAAAHGRPAGGRRCWRRCRGSGRPAGWGRGICCVWAWQGLRSTGRVRPRPLPAPRRPGVCFPGWRCTSIWGPTTWPGPGWGWSWRCLPRQRLPHSPSAGRRPSPQALLAAPSRRRAAGFPGDACRAHRRPRRAGRWRCGPSAGRRSRSGGRCWRTWVRRPCSRSCWRPGRSAGWLAAADAAVSLRLGHVQDGLGPVRPRAVDGAEARSVGGRPRRRQPGRPAAPSPARSAAGQLPTIPTW